MALSEKHLSNRRHQLVARCEVERVDMIERSREIQSLMSAIDHTVQSVQRIRQHPGIVLGALAAVLLIIKPRRVGALFGGVMSASRTWHAVAPVLHGLQQLRRHS